MPTLAPSDAVDLEHYPLLDVDRRQAVVSHARHSLAECGAAILPGFLRPEAARQMAGAAMAKIGESHRRDRLLGAYDTAVEPWMDADHPVRRTSPYRMNVLATDQLDASDPTLRLFEWDPLLDLVRDVLGLDELHRLTDPLMRCAITFLRDGDQHGWHFDGNDFVVSLLLQDGEAGGLFEYAPGVRSADAENYDAVRATMDEQPDTTRLLDLRPGTLALFQGRYALHRVTEVVGDRPRIIALFSYDEAPVSNHCADTHRRIFGRTVGEAPVP